MAQVFPRLAKGTFPETREGRQAYRRWRESQGRSLINEAKARPCMDCGGAFPPYVMQLDHVRGEKLFDIGSRAANVNRLVEEIAKCEVICANCHAIRSHSRRQNRIPAYTGVGKLGSEELAQPIDSQSFYISRPGHQTQTS